MKINFEQLILSFNKSPLPIDVIHRTTICLQEQTDETLSTFISEFSPSLLILERWAWKLFSQNSHQWANDSHYQELFHTFGSFNRKMIYNYDKIEIETKASLLLSVTIEQINNIFSHIERTTDDNDPFLTIINFWFDNHSHFIFDNPEYGLTSVIDYVGQYILQQYVMSPLYKSYLTQLREQNATESRITERMLFYIRTCSFYLYTYIYRRTQNLPYTPDEMIDYLGEDYLNIIHVHSRTLTSWNRNFLGCIAHVSGLVAGCCWWGGYQRAQMKTLFATEEIGCNYLKDVIPIFEHEPFYMKVTVLRSNYETILLDSLSVLVVAIVQTQNICWLFRSNATIRNAVLTVAEASPNERLCIACYFILGETLTDDQIKTLKIADRIPDYSLRWLEKAWNSSSKSYLKVTLSDLLRGCQALSKNDSIQRRVATSNGISFFMEICDQFPIAYDIIWTFSFNQDIQQQIRANSQFMSKLSHLAKECNDEQMKKIIHGILWNLDSNHEHRSTSEISSKETFDIMISYAHKDKMLCKQIYDELIKANYRVWIDFDQMHGNMMDAMAQAIDQSHTVILCMSEQYRQSNYCRAEAHYAFQRQRKIIPVLLQKHYKPDGWLLFLIGQLLYVDFIKHEFSRAMNILFEELKLTHILEIRTMSVCQNEDTTSVKALSEETRQLQVVQNISEWSTRQVHDWLIKHNLVQMSRLLVNCNGRSLVYLNRYMKQCQPQKILSLLANETHRKTNEDLSLVELACFQSLMDEQIPCVQEKI